MDKATLKQRFDEDGYVFIPSFLNTEEIAEMNAKIKVFIKEGLHQLPFNHIFYEDKADPGSLKQLQDLQHYDAFFNQSLNEGRFRELAETVLGEAVIGKNIEYFNKPAKIGKPTPPHQDGYYFMLNPSQAVTMWLALEEADESNGCVRYIPGSHKGPMRAHGKTATLGFSQGIVDYGDADRAVEIPFPAKAGDLLIHHSLTVHRADGNPSDRSRRAMGFIYFGESAKEDLERKAQYQESLKKERETAK